MSAVWISSLQPEDRQSILARQETETLAFLADEWCSWARLDQLPPARYGPGDEADAAFWTTWVVLGGRGSGKTRTGAEWLRSRMEGLSPLTGGKCRYAALIAESYSDARAVMVEGESGLLARAPSEQRPVFESSRRLLTWPNGARARLFSSEDPEALRGPQHDCAWADELAKWRYAQETWDMLQFGLRLGPRPQQVVTTTPRPLPLMKAMLARKDTALTRSRTQDNRANLAPAFFDHVIAAYQGTRLGRQELEGELIEGNPNALWQPGMIDAHRVSASPGLMRVVVAIDPPVSSGPDADECGILVAGRTEGGEAFVLADWTVQGLSPQGWAERAVAAYHEYEADRLVAEINQGGDMVKAVLAQVDPGVPVRLVRATRNKAVRAEPVAALYEQGRVHHVGTFRKLEDQMLDFDGDPVRGASPDRVDALVWALSDLMLRPMARPAVRSV